ncbi:asparagine synthase (glutamine-hydrolyzing) [Schleiferia thermophila]|uniref:asparagine synthase (glutamine-hydrolyzing) n=1 Tax=Schleiferia thermophila TaxID=884107 RepID=UPI003EEE3FD4
MCGIFGFISNSISESDLLYSTNFLKKRGPDAGGIYYDPPVGLGHRRLSVIDLNQGSQPMFSEDQSIVVVFNGEIYNFKKLKTELGKTGVEFLTQSDTEVIIKCYQAFGWKVCLEKLEGMFSIALLDKNLEKLFIARDRYGEKPLYYTRGSFGFMFSSELKALNSFFYKKKISLKGLNLYFSLTYIPAPYTIYEDVYKLCPGHYIVVDYNGNYEIQKYYDLKKIVHGGVNKLITDYDNAKKTLSKLLFESVEERMVSDVPIGSFLSGGIDSSIVSAIMAKISSEPVKTFSIGFKEKAYDESERAALVAKHIQSDHTLHVLGHEELLAVVDEVLAYFDEPFGDSSAIPSFMVSKKAREKVTVVLTGDGADELFGGYEKYLGLYYATRWKKIPTVIQNFIKNVISLIPHTNLTNHELRKAKKLINSASLASIQRYIQLSSLGFSDREKQELMMVDYYQSSDSDIGIYFSETSFLSELDSTFYSDINMVLEGDMLTKVDRMSMFNSLEARVPFLDSKIVDFSFRLPIHFKIQGKEKKKILKDTFADLLPPETLTFSKKGFGLPLRIWFKNELKSELLELLDYDFVELQGIFRANYIQKLIDEHMRNHENHSVKLWVLFVFQKWYQKQRF